MAKRNFVFTKKFQRVIQLELNEISSLAIDHLIAQKKLPYFAQLNKTWFYTTTTSEQSYEHIEPWIQWTTAHTGKTFSEHGIFHLSDVDQLQYPQIWETLSAHQIESCIVGSMNAARGNAMGGFFFPDPWAKAGIAHPEKFQSLWNLISRKVQSHATANITAQDLIKSWQACRELNLPFSLYAKIAYQLISQKINRLNKWKLAGLFDLFLTNIFNDLLKSSRYGYYTLFLNSVAHYQHHYWRNFQPQLFNEKITSPDCAVDHDPMTYGYELYDRIIQQALTLAKDPNTLVIIASGLSQQPFLDKENEGGMNYYRLYQHQQFINQLGLTHCRALPLMSRDWQLTADPTALYQAQLFLSALTVNQEPLFKVEQNSPTTLFIETAITRNIPAETPILNSQGQPIAAFGQYFHRTAVKSGHHDGNGSLWISQKPQNFSTELPLTDLYSLTLTAFGINPFKPSPIDCTKEELLIM